MTKIRQQNHIPLAHRLKNLGELGNWYRKNMEKVNFGYRSLEEYRRDWPMATYSGEGVWRGYEGHPDYDVNLESGRQPLKLSPLQYLSSDLLKSNPVLKKVDMPQGRLLKDRVTDISLSYSKYGGADDAGVVDKLGRYFTLTLDDGSTRRFSPKTYKRYFGEYSLLDPNKKLNVYR